MLRSKFSSPCLWAAALVMLLVRPVDAQVGPSRLDRNNDQSFRAGTMTMDGLDKVDVTDDGVSAQHPGIALYTGAALFEGYDSNLDLSTTNRKGSGFTGIEGGAGAIIKRDGSETTMVVRGTEQRYNLGYRPDRWDAGTYLDHHVALENGMKLTVGGFYYRDEIETDRSQRYAAYLSLDREGDTQDTFVRVRSLHRNYLNGVGTTLPEGTITDVDTSFSNTRTELVAGALLMKDQRLAPFVQVGLASIDFTNQINTDVLNRDSREAFVISGVRLRFNTSLYADLGGRLNTRSISDSNIRNHSSAFFDGKLVWEPNKYDSIELSVDRTNQDPLTTGALFSEETAVRFALKFKPVPRIHTSLETGFIRQDQIGVGFHFDERYVEGKVGYAFAPRAEIFVFGKAADYTNSQTREHADDFRLGAGIKIRN